jgi:hypothetical protein
VTLSHAIPRRCIRGEGLGTGLRALPVTHVPQAIRGLYHRCQDLTIVALRTPNSRGMTGIADISQMSEECQPGCIAIRRSQEDIPAGKKPRAEITSGLNRGPAKA